VTEPFDFDRACEGPFEFLEVKGTGEHLLPDAVRDRVLVLTVHDGTVVPPQFRSKVRARELAQAYVRERDWGANLVAHNLACELGLPGYGRVTIARVLLDFNRFPGTTPPNDPDPLERLAIQAPFSETLTHPEKMRVLDIYDRISALIEPHLQDKLIVFAVHTYDEHNPSLTSRPHLSLVTQSAHYQREATMPYGVFDPMYPDVLGESTCSRILRDRISLNLERSGFRVSNNHPYALPDGSIEVRAQVWYFFAALRRLYTDRFPRTADDPAHQVVWEMVLNTNLRQARAEALRGYLHRYQRAASRDADLFAQAQASYAKIAEFLRTSSALRDYRRWSERPSSIALEVRKDLLCEIEADGSRPKPPTPSMHARARQIARTVAGAVETYFVTDREEIRHFEGDT
jgi:hypothetical protein